MAPHLGELLRYAPDRSDEHDLRQHQSWVLEALGPHLLPAQLPEALDAVLRLRRSHWWSPSPLEGLAPRLAELQAPKLRPLWQRALHGLAVMPRFELLLSLSVLEPVISKLGGQRALRSTLDAVMAAGRCWS